MQLFQRIFFAAVLAGLAAGLVMSAFQQWKVVPLILQAETFEATEQVHDHAVVAHEHAPGTPAHDDAVPTTVAPTHAHDENAWTPQDGLERALYTVLADVLGSIAFAFLLVATAIVVKIDITPRNGLLWGLGGWIAFQLAPAFGLPPELPGMAAADLGARQLWWWGTAIASAGAFLLIAKRPNPVSFAIGTFLLLAPHVIGAPVAPDEPSVVPAHLATAFAASALTVSALFWLLVGPLIGYFNQVFQNTAPATRSATL
ncbi:CbtA family protein [Devosia rhodophyticola]|uniref:CbtA family protein n=1 Tax=Devosia rhodophyticola TaxID=3026423 RepID=A0ABY7YZC1_9HYPH|nr:CbtA family protein [Devosia rhodophyticola]WDR06601.1 CbtA family protein [Devosia rhodophyticola]